MRMWRNWDLHTFQVRMKNGTAALVSSLAVSQKDKYRVTIRPSNSTLRHTPKRMKTQNHDEACTFMFIGALFLRAREWKPSTCPPTEERINKMWPIHAMKYYSAIKKE